MEYGLGEYELFSLQQLQKEYEKELYIEVEGRKTDKIGEIPRILLEKEQGKFDSVLLKQQEKITLRVEKEKLSAPIEKQAEPQNGGDVDG